MYGDFSDIFYDISNAAKKFQSELSKYAQERGYGDSGVCGRNDGDSDYDWPPVNIYTTEDGAGSIVFEFGLAGFYEEDINLTFQGEYMVLSAVYRAALKNCEEQNSGETEETHYIKKTLRLDNIEKQKYYVPTDKYTREKTNAVYKNGLLIISIPKKEEDEQDGVKIKISS
ncbi:MAG: Hsp20/alpha crystallin family protein [Spirochaetaceae bacterium]|jgi:HSP20 family molecular chaperone IbpA|nr:Hsp20/alpha crystallin family protein [Spirochaetaceae bacterium]